MDEGTPQGGPFSPLLSNLVLDDLDKELTRRGLRVCRYADDCNIYVRSHRGGERVMASVSRFLTDRLKLKVNEAKSAVAQPAERKFLGLASRMTGASGALRLSTPSRARPPGSVDPPKTAHVSLAAERDEPLQGTASQSCPKVPGCGRCRFADGVLASVRTSGGANGPAQPRLRLSRSASILCAR